MVADRLTLIDGGRAVELAARFDSGGVRLPAAEVQKGLGWELKPEGLCREGLCVPVDDTPGLVNEDGIDLASLARVLRRPLALDVTERAAYLGESAAERAAQLATLQAPDFTLPDLDGRPHSLSEHCGGKVLLIAYASW